MTRRTKNSGGHFSHLAGCGSFYRAWTIVLLYLQFEFKNEYLKMYCLKSEFSVKMEIFGKKMKTFFKNENFVENRKKI